MRYDTNPDVADTVMPFMPIKPEPTFPKRVSTEARTLLSLGLPIIAAQLLQMSMNFVDTVMAGRLSAVDLAAVAIGFSSMMPFFVFGLATVMAVNPIAAQNWGSRRFDLIGSNARQALWLSQIIALPIFFIIRHMDIVMVWIDVSPEVIPIAHGYLKAISWGMFPLLGYGALRYFNEGLSVSRPGMYVALIATLLNIPLNYILMYGKLGFPQLGAIGTGYASAIVYLFMFGGMLWFTWNFKPFKRFDIFGKFRLPNRQHLRELIYIGVPIGVSGSMEVAMFAIVSLLMGSIGTIAVAGHQIAINFAAIVFMVPFGLSMAITSRVGQSAGKKRIAEARFRGFTGVAICTVFMSFTAIVMILFPDLIVSIYTDDEAVFDTARQLLLMAAIFQLSDGMQVGGFGTLRGLKDTRFPMVVNIFAYMIVGLPVAWYLGFPGGMGPVGLWIGLIAGLTIAGICHNARFYVKTR